MKRENNVSNDSSPIQKNALHKQMTHCFTAEDLLRCCYSPFYSQLFHKGFGDCKQFRHVDQL